MGARAVVDTALVVVDAAVVVVADRELVGVLPGAIERLAGEVHDVVKTPTATRTRHNQATRMPSHHARQSGLVATVSMATFPARPGGGQTGTGPSLSGFMTHGIRGSGSAHSLL